MKVKELIQRLEAIKKTSGNIEVVLDNGYEAEVAVVTDEDTGEDTVVLY